MASNVHRNEILPFKTVILLHVFLSTLLAPRTSPCYLKIEGGGRLAHIHTRAQKHTKTGTIYVECKTTVTVCICRYIYTKVYLLLYLWHIFPLRERPPAATPERYTYRKHTHTPQEGEMSSFPAGLNTTASLHTEKETIYVTNFTCPFRRATFHFGEERFSKTCRQQQRTVIDKGGNRKEARAERKNFVDGYSVLPVVVDDVSHSLCAITPRCNHYLSSTVRFAPTLCNTHHTFIHFRMETRLIVPQKKSTKTVTILS